MTATTSRHIGVKLTVKVGEQFLVRLHNHLGSRELGVEFNADADRVTLRVVDDLPALARLQIVRAAAEVLGSKVTTGLGMRYVNGEFVGVPITVLTHIAAEVTS